MTRHTLTTRTFVRHARAAWLAAVLAGVSLAACGTVYTPGESARAASGRTAQAVVAPTPRLTSADNFRDVAGPDDQRAYRTTAGQPLRRGLIYRSNALALAPADLATLGGLGILSVFDLRRPDEIAQTPDVLPQGVSYLNIDVISSADTPSPTTAADAVAWMEGLYRRFVTDAATRARFGDLMRALANGTAPQVYHCTGGKDRTGWTTVVVLNVAGVPQSEIARDYMLTNTYSAASIQSSYDALASARGRTMADAYRPMMDVRESYLQAAVDQVSRNYGSMSAYITNGLGVDTETQARLRARLTSR
jgi:protein-tyrosine phosphatase